MSKFKTRNSYYRATLLASYPGTLIDGFGSNIWLLHRPGEFDKVEIITTKRDNTANNHDNNIVEIDTSEAKKHFLSLGLNIKVVIFQLFSDPQYRRQAVVIACQDTKIHHVDMDAFLEDNYGLAPAFRSLSL